MLFVARSRTCPGQSAGRLPHPPPPHRRGHSVAGIICGLSSFALLFGALIFWLATRKTETPQPPSPRVAPGGEWLASGGWVRGADDTECEFPDAEPTPRQLEFLEELHEELGRAFRLSDYTSMTRGEVSRAISALLAEKRET